MIKKIIYRIRNWIRRVILKKEYLIGVDWAEGSDKSIKVIWEKNLKTGVLTLKRIEELRYD